MILKSKIWILTQSYSKPKNGPHIVMMNVVITGWTVTTSPRSVIRLSMKIYDISWINDVLIYVCESSEIQKYQSSNEFRKHKKTEKKNDFQNSRKKPKDQNTKVKKNFPQTLNTQLTFFSCGSRLEVSFFFHFFFVLKNSNILKSIFICDE
jgi:hypothetical protein